MEIKSEKITPDMAQEFLKKNISNRNVNRHRIKSYVNDMQGGRWTFNPSPIVFGEDGSLMDGQHRLIAIVESGVTIESLVMTGAPQTCKDTIDSGKPRTAGDAISIKGVPNANNVAAIASRIISFEKYKNAPIGNANSWASSANPSKAEVVEYTMDKMDYLQSLYVKGDELYRSCPIRVLAPSEIGFLFHAIVPEDKANPFLTKVVSGIGLVDHTPELTLRRVLEKTRVSKELHYGNADLHALIFIAFEKSKNGESCDILRLPKKSEKNR